MTWTGYWSERAGRAEADLDDLAELVTRHVLARDLGLPWRAWSDLREALGRIEAGRDRRYRPLPAGETLTGTLTSGGIVR